MFNTAYGKRVTSRNSQNGRWLTGVPAVTACCKQAQGGWTAP